MPRGTPNTIARGTMQNRAALTPQKRGAMTRKANAGTRATATQKATASNKAIASTTATAGARNKTAPGKKAGAKSPTRKRTAGRGAGEERLRPIARAQTLPETVANIAIRAQQPMDTVRRVLQATQRVAEAHLCRGGSGKIALPYLGVQIYRAQQAARPARTLPLFGTGRTMNLRKVPARAIARARLLLSMRNATQR